MLRNAFVKEFLSSCTKRWTLLKHGLFNVGKREGLFILMKSNTGIVPKPQAVVLRKGRNYVFLFAIGAAIGQGVVGSETTKLELDSMFQIKEVKSGIKRTLCISSTSVDHL